jgi:hypothetical protein
MENELIETAPQQDSAAQAFNELRQQISLMLRALAKFMDEHPPVEIPDYTDTLNQMRDYTGSLASSLKKLRETPVLQTTAEQIANQIAAVGADARKGEQAALTRAIAENIKLTSDLSRYLEQAKTANRQNLWVAGALAGGLLMGLALMGLIWFKMSDSGDNKPAQAVEQHQPAKAKRR